MKKLVLFVTLMMLISLWDKADADTLGGVPCTGPGGFCTVTDWCRVLALCFFSLDPEATQKQYSYAGGVGGHGTEYYKTRRYLGADAPIRGPKSGRMWAKVSDWITVGGQPLKHTYACIQDDVDEFGFPSFDPRLNDGIVLTQRWVCDANIGSSDKGAQWGAESNGSPRKFWCASGLNNYRYMHVGKPYKLNGGVYNFFGFYNPDPRPRWEGTENIYHGRKPCRILEFITGTCHQGANRMLFSSSPRASVAGVEGSTWSYELFGKTGNLFSDCKLACNL